MKSTPQPSENDFMYLYHKRNDWKVVYNVNVITT